MFSSKIPKGSPNLWVISSTWAKIFLKQMFLNHHNPVMIRNESKQPKRTFLVHFLKRVDVTTLHPNCDIESLGCFGDPPPTSRTLSETPHILPKPLFHRQQAWSSTLKVSEQGHMTGRQLLPRAYKLLNNWVKLELSFMTISFAHNIFGHLHWYLFVFTTLHDSRLSAAMSLDYLKQL